MQRIYFLVPSLDAINLIVADLLLAQVEERQVDILARRGRLLLMIDVPSDRVSEIHELVQNRHRAAACGDAERLMKAFP